MHGGTALKYPKDKVYDRLASDLPINTQWAPAVVDDPYDRTSKLKVLRSVRDDRIAIMFDAGDVDIAQFNAARQWQRCYEMSEIGGARAIDPSKEAVDGGGAVQMFSDSRLQASLEMRKVWKILGPDRGAMTHDLLISNLSVGQIAQRRGRLDLLPYYQSQIVDCLEVLVRFFKLG